MNFIKRFKEKMEYKKSSEYQNYLNALENNKKDIVRFKEYYLDTLNKLKNLMSQNTSDVNEIDRLKNELKRWKYEYDNSVLKADFIRPNTNEEIEKRKDIEEKFVNELTNIVGGNSNLRFHGTPIYFAREIIKSGMISSTADRYEGFINSTDESGFISASSINSLGRTINYFSDFSSYMRSLPCGVLFVLNEKDGDYNLRDRSEMQNVNFKTNPEQLVGIVCTDEVKDMVFNWCINYNMDKNKVFTFNEFLEYAKNNDLEKSKTL